ncbi:MAG: leucine-rich repeat protein, partial [Treponema sp.]|nr:leucine-rich repeat protein [Treponema sp.]
TTIDVTPRPNDENLTQAGSGTLSYRFIFPEGAAATLKLYTLDGEETGETIDLAETETACEGILVLDSGFYYAGVVVEHEGKMAVWRELAHIYDGAVTEAVYEFSVNDFIYSAAGAIMQFSFSLAYEYVYPIDQDAKTINVIVPPGTDTSALKATVSYTGAMLTPGQGEAADFSVPVTYTVHTGDIEESYTVTVTDIIDTIEVLADYLAYCGGIENDEPVAVKFGASLTENTWLDLLDTIALAEDKLIDLDLSACTPGNDTGGLRSDGTFDPMWDIETGKANIKKFILPDAATVILDGYYDPETHYFAFRYFTGLEAVTGRDVNYIGEMAFYGNPWQSYTCSALEEADFPEAITLGFQAFYYCENLVKINFPKVVTIGESAFHYNNALTEVNFPEAITIGDWAFLYCISLAEVSFPKVVTIGNSALARCALEEVSFPKVVTIDIASFAYCSSLATVIFPMAEIINDGAFTSCTTLSDLNFPEVVTICNSAFAVCTALTSVNFPKVITIDERAFELCTNLTNANFPKAETIGEMSFHNCALVDVNFPKVVTIGFWAFYCSAFVNVSFPEVITIGNEAFEYCINLTDINLPKVEGIGNYSFLRCTSLTNLYIPSVKELGDYVFQNTGAQALNITMGPAAPTFGSSLFRFYMFMGTPPPEQDTAGKNVTVYVPDPATYDTVWQNKFKEDPGIVLTVKAIE